MFSNDYASNSLMETKIFCQVFGQMKTGSSENELSKRASLLSFSALRESLLISHALTGFPYSTNPKAPSTLIRFRLKTHTDAFLPIVHTKTPENADENGDV